MLEFTSLSVLITKGTYKNSFVQEYIEFTHLNYKSIKNIVVAHQSVTQIPFSLVPKKGDTSIQATSITDDLLSGKAITKHHYIQPWISTEK